MLEPLGAFRHHSGWSRVRRILSLRSSFIMYFLQNFFEKQSPLINASIIVRMKKTARHHEPQIRYTDDVHYKPINKVSTFYIHFRCSLTNFLIQCFLRARVLILLNNRILYCTGRTPSMSECCHSSPCHRYASSISAWTWPLVNALV